MEDNLHSEYSEYIDPILSDSTIWANRIRFYKEYKALGARLHSAGYSNKYISDIVNVLPPIEARASCFNENSTTDSEELRRLTLSLQA